MISGEIDYTWETGQSQAPVKPNIDNIIKLNY